MKNRLDFVATRLILESAQPSLIRSAFGFTSCAPNLMSTLQFGVFFLISACSVRIYAHSCRVDIKVGERELPYMMHTFLHENSTIELTTTMVIDIWRNAMSSKIVSKIYETCFKKAEFQEKSESDV